MPRQDGTGPKGQGPMTGRGIGPCRGGMRGVWGGCGCRRYFSPKNELAALEDMEKTLEEELAALREEKAALKAEQK